MKIENKTVKGRFVKRLNRFEGIVNIDGKESLVHIPNTGRCRELLTDGASVILEIRDNPARKTPYELIMAYKGEMLVSIDSHAPNRIVEEAIKQVEVEEFMGYSNIKKEAAYGNSRFDLLLKKDENSTEKDSCFVEVKGVTLELDGVAMFPDAPTERGAKHVNELVQAHRCGYRTAIVFLIQMEDVESFSPNTAMDQKFSEALRHASENGVEIFAFNCKVNEREVVLKGRIRVLLR